MFTATIFLPTKKLTQVEARRGLNRQTTLSTTDPQINKIHPRSQGGDILRFFMWHFGSSEFHKYVERLKCKFAKVSINSVHSFSRCHWRGLQALRAKEVIESTISETTASSHQVFFGHKGALEQIKKTEWKLGSLKVVLPLITLTISLIISLMSKQPH